MDLKQVNAFFNNLCNNLTDEYEVLENSVLFDDLNIGEEKEALYRINKIQDEIGLITSKEREPLKKALQVANLNIREKIILENPIEVIFSQGGKVAGVYELYEDIDGYKKGFQIVIEDFGSQKIGNIVG